jgi:hypothetical protein
MDTLYVVIESTSSHSISLIPIEKKNELRRNKETMVSQQMPPDLVGTITDPPWWKLRICTCVKTRRDPPGVSEMN